VGLLKESILKINVFLISVEKVKNVYTVRCGKFFKYRCVILHARYGIHSLKLRLNNMFLIGVEVRQAPQSQESVCSAPCHTLPWTTMSSGGRQVSASIALMAVSVPHVILKEASVRMLFSLLLALAGWRPSHRTSDAMVIDGWVEMAWLIVPLLAFWKIKAVVT
jgi:hypothetical protein